jgi:hypothetical protein
MPLVDSPHAKVLDELQSGRQGEPSTMQIAPLVTYIRVSTSGQGRSGLGR